MKKFITPTLVLIGFFALIYAILSSTDHANNIALFGAGYAAFLVAIYTLIYSIKNPTMKSMSPSDGTALYGRGI